VVIFSARVWGLHGEREGVMTRIHIIVLAGAVALLVCGCGAPSQSTGLAVDSGRPVQLERQARRPRPERYGFAVLDFRAFRDDFGMVSVVGEIENVGTITRGVELQATLRDADDRPVAVGHFYPASNNNIVPGESWPFSYSFGRRQDAVRAELRIVGTFRTIDTLNASAMP
jgi:hypothetical protein